MTKTNTLLSMALLFAACTTGSAIEESRKYQRLGDLNRSFSVIDEAKEDRLRRGETIDAAFESEHAAARQRYLLERARERIFGEDENDALADLATLLELDPTNEEAKILQQRAREKQAKRATAAGDEHMFKKELHEALVRYLEAEKYVPGFPDAVKGADRVKESFSLLTQKAQQQFLEAARKLPEFRFVEVRWHSANVVVNDPTRDDAKSMNGKVKREIAKLAVERGKQCVAKDQFGAALIEFREAQALDKDQPGVAELIDQMKREVEAIALSDRAAMFMRSARFGEANDCLKRAFEMSTTARGNISELMIESRRLEGEHGFERARDLEIIGKKREAMVAFEKLAAAWPTGLRDEQGRIDGLRSDIAAAEQEWALGEAAEAKKDLESALEHFSTSERFYPEFKNAKERIARLRVRLAAQAKRPGS